MKTCTWQEPDDYCMSLVEGRTDFCARHNRLIRKISEEEKKAIQKHNKLTIKQKEKNSLPRKSVKPVSDKRKAENPIYSERRKIFLEGKQCAVFPNLKATQVHHQAGRKGYVDQWAYDNGITAFLDERFWLPVSEEGHIKIEADTIWAKDMGFSIVRSVPIKQTI